MRFVIVTVAVPERCLGFRRRRSGGRLGLLSVVLRRFFGRLSTRIQAEGVSVYEFVDTEELGRWEDSTRADHLTSWGRRFYQPTI